MCWAHQGRVGSFFFWGPAWDLTQRGHHTMTSPSARAKHSFAVAMLCV